MRDALKAAREWGTRPLVMLGSPLAGDDWSEADRFLAQALTLHDADICPGGCGHYLDETSVIDGWHEVKTIVCDACQARDMDREERKDDPPVPGALAYVVSTREDPAV